MSFETMGTGKSRHWDQDDFENLAEGEAMAMTLTHLSVPKIGVLSPRCRTSRTRLYLGLMCVLFSGFFHDAHAETFPVKVTDDRGSVHVFPSPPSRVISLDPAQTEMLFYLGYGARLVGRTSACDFPEAASSVQSVGSTVPPNFERIVSLSPDLLLMMAGQDTVRHKFEEMGIPVLVGQPATVAQVARNMRRLTQVMGSTPEALRKITDFERRLEALAISPPKGAPTIFYQVWAKPLMTSGPNTFLADVLRVSGGQNLLSESLTDWPQVSSEKILTLNPDVVLVGRDDDRAAWMSPAGLWSVTKAHRNRAVYVIPDVDHFVRPGPRILDGVAWLSRTLKVKPR